MHFHPARSLRKILALAQRSRLDRELAEEMETHRILLARDGGNPGPVMGNMTLAREESREMWTFRQLEWIFQDARHALRGLRRSPAFTCIAIASLALGIGANTAIFSFVNAILLKRLPVPEPERLVTFAETYQGEHSAAVWSMPSVDELATRASSFDGVFGWFGKPVSFSRGETAQWVMGEMVTGEYFRTLQVKPAIGRLLDDDDVRNAVGNPVCVLSYEFWQREFAGSLGVIGQRVFLNGHPYRVLGVAARGFFGAVLQSRFDVVVPATRVGDFMPAFAGVDWLNKLSWMSPMARLKPGVSRIQAEQETERRFPDWRERQVNLEDGSHGINAMRSSYGSPVLVLMAVVALVLLVACANLANLLLARAQARAQEFAVRLSIGASRARLIRQLLVESVLLAIGGGVAGVLLALWIKQHSRRLHEYGQIRIDGHPCGAGRSRYGVLHSLVVWDRDPLRPASGLASDATGPLARIEKRIRCEGLREPGTVAPKFGGRPDRFIAGDRFWSGPAGSNAADADNNRPRVSAGSRDRAACRPRGQRALQRRNLQHS
jgi:hypothetical protein